MIIDFDTLPLQILDNFKGGNLHYDANIYDDGNNKIMRGTLVPGASIGMHRHIGNSEIMFITEGTGTVICDGTETTVTAGQCHYCPEGSEHTLRNDTTAPLRFFAVVATKEQLA